MSPLPPTAGDEDKAWVTIRTPLRPEELRAFCEQLEYLYRINPYLEFRQWRATGADRYRAELRNHSNAQDVTFEIRVERGSENSFRAHYDKGIKRATDFRIEPDAQGSCLTITDIYGGLTSEERQARAAEVDKSLNAWGHALHVFFRRWKRWRWIAPWRWYMRRLWMPMKPSARRIAWMLILITTVEFLFFLFVLLIYAIE